MVVVLNLSFVGTKKPSNKLKSKNTIPDRNILNPLLTRTDRFSSK